MLALTVRYTLWDRVVYSATVLEISMTTSNDPLPDRSNHGAITLVFHGQTTLTREFRESVGAAGGQVRTNPRGISLRGPAPRSGSPEEQLDWALGEVRRLRDLASAPGVESRRIHLSHSFDAQLSLAISADWMREVADSGYDLWMSFFAAE